MNDNDKLHTLTYDVAEAAHLVASAQTPSVRLQRMIALRELTMELFAAGVTANIDQVADEMEAEQDAR